MKWRDITREHNGKKAIVWDDDPNNSFFVSKSEGRGYIDGEILVYPDGIVVLVTDRYFNDNKPKVWFHLTPDVNVKFIDEEELAKKETMESHIQILPIIPCAKWTDDCQGKKDYDGRLLSISTRYWPARAGELNPSAHSAIHINWGEPDQYGYGDYIVLRSAEFTASTEAEVRVMVETWVKEQMTDIIKKLID